MIRWSGWSWRWEIQKEDEKRGRLKTSKETLKINSSDFIFVAVDTNHVSKTSCKSTHLYAFITTKIETIETVIYNIYINIL